MNIGKEFSSKLISSEISEISLDSLDQILSSELFKDIPIVGKIVGLFKTVNNISNFLFLKKILAFLRGIEDISQEERAKLINEIDNSKKHRIKVGEQLLYIIDKSSDHEVVEYIAFLFAAYIRGEIDYSSFLKGSSILNNISIDDFKAFVKIDSLDKKHEDDYTEYSSARLIYLYTEESYIERNEDRESYNDNEYIIKGGQLNADFTDIGNILRKVFNNCKLLSE